MLGPGHIVARGPRAPRYCCRMISLGASPLTFHASTCDCLFPCCIGHATPQYDSTVAVLLYALARRIWRPTTTFCLRKPVLLLFAPTGCEMSCLTPELVWTRSFDMLGLGPRDFAQDEQRRCTAHAIVPHNFSLSDGVFDTCGGVQLMCSCHASILLLDGTVAPGICISAGRTKGRRPIRLDDKSAQSTRITASSRGCRMAGGIVAGRESMGGLMFAVVSLSFWN